MPSHTAADIEMRLLLEAVYAKYSHDFRDYSGASIKRRVQHALQQLGCATISQLQSRERTRRLRQPSKKPPMTLAGAAAPLPPGAHLRERHG